MTGATLTPKYVREMSALVLYIVGKTFERLALHVDKAEVIDIEKVLRDGRAAHAKVADALDLLESAFGAVVDTAEEAS